MEENNHPLVDSLGLPPPVQTAETVETVEATPVTVPRKKQQRKRNPVAAREARRINTEFGDSTPKDQVDFKLGSAIAPKRRDFMRIVKMVGDDLQKIDPSLPKNISPVHYAVVKKVIQLALREEMAYATGYCPQCKKYIVPQSFCPVHKTPIEIQIPDDKLEKNSNQMREVMMKRIAPELKMANTTININNTMINLTSGIAQIISEFVPPDKKMECNIKIRTLLGSYKNAIAESTPG